MLLGIIASCELALTLFICKSRDLILSAEKRNVLKNFQDKKAKTTGN